MKQLLLITLGLVLFSLSLNASMNVTYLNTTLILNTNNSAHVIETLSLSISNNSVQQYLQDRDAVNLTLSDWGAVLNTNLLVEHILNPQSSIINFTFLPGPIQYVGTGAVAKLEMNYYVDNVTMVNETAPRVFKYTFNPNVFNFQHTASGQALLQNSQLNIVLPQGAQIISVYPLPDYPTVSFIGNLSNATYLSWHSGEPLAKFSLQYLLRESLEQEVIGYFTGLYKWAMSSIFLIIIAVAVVALGYIASREYLGKGR